MTTRRDLLRVAALTGLSTAVAPAALAQEPVSPNRRERTRLSTGWRFHLGHAQSPDRDFGFGAHQTAFAKAAAKAPEPASPTYDDSLWAQVALPHDWAVELPFAQPPALDPLVKEDPRAAHGFKPVGREFPETSVGWYRMSLQVPASDLGRRLSLEFDGAFRDCTVFVNGFIVGQNASGYAPFRCDFSDVANYGGVNTVLVRVDASQGEGWFYEGAGLYRHVWLVKTDALHVPQYGVVVRSQLGADGAAALSLITEVRLEADQDRDCELISTVIGPDGKPVGEVRSAVSARAWQTVEAAQSLTLPRPALWSLETPNLYQLRTVLRAGELELDRVETSFGVRTLKFDPEAGFFLNGRSVKLKGTCNHQDHAGLGVALPDRMHWHRVERLKTMGSNAWRAAHNPPSTALLDACDKLGMLVIDETRRMSSEALAMDELTRMVRRDRNRPSVILWSIGNEEPHQGTAVGARIAHAQKRLINQLDGTRLITEALDSGWGEGVTPELDVLGFNYRTTKMDEFHAKFPHIPVLGSETASTVTTRGVYQRDAKRQFTTAYDTEAPWWATTAEGWWPYVDARPYIAGGFIWTGFDYRGEPTPFNNWPSVASYFGVLDSCGFEKDEFYYYKAWWRDEPQVHLLPHWTWPGREGQPIDVWCYANVERVELFLNGVSQGVQTVKRNAHLSWKVNYQPGLLEARGYVGGRMVLREVRETAGASARLAVSADRPTLRADGQDVAVVKVAVLDARGRAVPEGRDRISFEVTGPGRLIGVGNGDPTSHEPDKASSRLAFKGLAMGIVQSRAEQSGVVRLTVRAEGLAPAELLLASAR
jgi:beta-galactosidase